MSKEWRTCKSFELAQTPCLWLAISSCMQAIMLLPKVYFCLGITFWRISYHYLKSRFFKNRKLYRPNLPQNSNLGRESFVQKSGALIPVGEGQIFCHFSFFLHLFHFVHKRLNIKTYTNFFVYKIKFVQYIYFNW